MKGVYIFSHRSVFHVTFLGKTVMLHLVKCTSLYAHSSARGIRIMLISCCATREGNTSSPRIALSSRLGRLQPRKSRCAIVSQVDPWCSGVQPATGRRHPPRPQAKPKGLREGQVRPRGLRGRGVRRAKREGCGSRSSCSALLARPAREPRPLSPTGLLNVRNDLQELHRDCGEAMKKTVYRHYTAFVALAEKVPAMDSELKKLRGIIGGLGGQLEALKAAVKPATRGAFRRH